MDESKRKEIMIANRGEFFVRKSVPGDRRLFLVGDGMIDDRRLRFYFHNVPADLTPIENEIVKVAANETYSKFWIEEIVK